MKIAIIADDFTGANDVGVQLNKYGLNVVTALEEIESSDVIIYNTESRNIDEDEAKKKVEEKFKMMKERKFNYFYKKIDSTLRGNLSKEIEAIVENIGADEKVVVAAAFPIMGRVIKNGEHFLNGKRVVETEIAKDPVAPVTEGDLKKIFHNSINIRFEELINGSAEKKIRESSEKIIIFDSETEEELEECAKFLVKTGYDKYIAGSAGIMNYLPELWGIKNRVAIISGSCSTVSIEQINRVIDINEGQLEIVNFDIRDEMVKKNSYKIKKDIVLRSVMDKKDVDEVMEFFMKKGVSRKEAGGLITDFIAEESAKYIIENEIKNLIIMGGETSYKVLKKIGIKSLKIEYEVETGIAVAKSENMRYNIIVKPGNFGSENCINRCYQILKKRKFF